ncbi:heme-binding protein [Sphingomonas sp. CL5.1]|uniref:GlcG/HbpS family heme-binding protein n=1 Tax=Sphingomonas sp. CL5.1 TaxID=2653203 RepID=UPI001581EDB2|nr:heme-binding protein [Sphingomonas sp. CL5.1]QKR99933.1 heme-binding protein [Sphingomonas sp. CL5.1]
MIEIKRLDAHEAVLLVAAARERALEIGVPMCIAVVDESGYLLAFQRMDGGKIHSIQVAMDKAFTAASARRPTHELADLSQPGSPLFGLNVALGGRICIVGGGMPLVVGGDVVGAVGISSGTPAQDRECAAAAVAAFAKLLER